MNKIKEKILNNCHLIGIFIIIAIFCFYSICLSYPFFIVDDSIYVFKNIFLQKGLNIDAIFWAFTTNYYGHYIPITWLSYLIDVSIFGFENPFGHRLVNIIIHSINCLMVFLILTKLKIGKLVSYAVVLVFAFSAVSVETVVWISSRKDLLSAFFLFFGVNYTLSLNNSNNSGNFVNLKYSSIVQCVLFTLASLAKPSIVATYFSVLFLIDLSKRINIKNDKNINLKNLLKDIGGVFVRNKFKYSYLIAITVVVLFFGHKNQDYNLAIDNFASPTNFIDKIFFVINKLVTNFYGSLDLSLFTYPALMFYFTNVQTVLALCLFSIMFLALLFCYESKKQAYYLFLALIIFLISVIPYCSADKVGQQNFAARFVYLAQIGTALFVLLVFTNNVITTFLRRFRLHYSLILLVFIGYTLWSGYSHLINLATFSRLNYYAMQKNPNNFIAKSNFYKYSSGIQFQESYQELLSVFVSSNQYSEELFSLIKKEYQTTHQVNIDHDILPDPLLNKYCNLIKPIFQKVKNDFSSLEKTNFLFNLLNYKSIYPQKCFINEFGFPAVQAFEQNINKIKNTEEYLGYKIRYHFLLNEYDKAQKLINKFIYNNPETLKANYIEFENLKFQKKYAEELLYVVKILWTQNIIPTKENNVYDNIILSEFVRLANLDLNLNKLPLGKIEKIFLTKQIEVLKKILL